MWNNFSSLIEFLEMRSLRRLRILVVGDLILDCYVAGDITRISPEAPIPILRLHHETFAPGGAANTAANILGLGCQVSVVGAVGMDKNGEKLIQLLKDSGMGTEGVIWVRDRPTVMKTRFVYGHHQLLRVDIEKVETLPFSIKREILSEVIFAGLWDVIILSDYAKGFLDAELCQKLIQWAKDHNISIIVDPKGKDYGKYRGATGITPNLHELGTIQNDDLVSTADVIIAGQKLREKFEMDFILATQGAEGMTLINNDGVLSIPAVASQIFDVTGAGDTVTATLAVAIAGKVDLVDGVRLANIAAGIAVSKPGTSAIDLVSLKQAVYNHNRIASDRVLTLETLLKQVSFWKSQGEKIVFTNGCFDLLHYGHVTYLEQSRTYGHRLIVGINTDRIVRLIKGENRPYVPERERAILIASLSSVDAVVLFDESTPISLIRAISPDVLVKGGDYNELDIVGAMDVKKMGGQVIVIPYIENHSSSQLARQISRLYMEKD